VLQIDPRKVNMDPVVVDGFGQEWQRFNQRSLDVAECQHIYNDYFHIFPWDALPSAAVGADIGCGSGRWAKIVAPLVGTLYAVDASEDALSVARVSLISFANVYFYHASVGSLPFADSTLDFAYSLGVLHHVPDTCAAIREVSRILKPGAPFLVYLYYSFDNKPFWYRAVWKVSDVMRNVIARIPSSLRYLLSELIAISLYWPMARIASWLDRRGHLPSAWPLAYYRDKSFYTMRTDALDRFGTRLEQRFSRSEITQMLQDAGFVKIKFSDSAPYWCAVCVKE